ncbi:MAG: glycogen synthase GlgA [Sporolactobacillus sp.]|nr:glycogen synthase GlgA [Sporolactobacillus sp.]
MNVLMAASECAPFVKTGGLGDVIGSLPKALRMEKISACVMLPKYEDLSGTVTKRLIFHRSFTVTVGWRKQYCGLLSLEEAGVRYYFLDNEYYFKRHGCYGYEDDGERFAFFCRAVVEAMPLLAERPDIVHCHDWQTGPIAALLKSDHYRRQPFYHAIKTVFTIHNLKYQGIFPYSVLHDLLGLDDGFFTIDGLEFYGAVSFLKAGLAYSDRLTTVSRTYAAEVQTPYYGERLDGFLRRRGAWLTGIVNGIDDVRYNPATDAQLIHSYSRPDGKAPNKRALQRRLGLSERATMPLIAMVTRLAEQKGIDLVLRVFDEMLALDIQFVLLGTGAAHYEAAFHSLAKRHPAKVAACLRFDDGLARQIYAASDLFLMPSKFEPCGIGQLLAMRYGSLPLIRETGGLKDTVIACNDCTDEGYGFSFTNYNAHDMLHCLARAVGFYRKKPLVWKRLVERAMALDFSWKTSAAAYIRLYRSLLEAEPE